MVNKIQAIGEINDAARKLRGCGKTRRPRNKIDHRWVGQWMPALNKTIGQREIRYDGEQSIKRRGRVDEGKEQIE